MGTSKILIVAALCAAIAVCATQCLGVEFRGAWVTSWEPGIFNKQEIDDTVAAAKKAGLNALVVEVRKCADAYYDSKIEPMGPEMPQGFDSLAYVIEKAHAEGIQVHAWLVVYRVWNMKTPPDDPKHVLRAHPDWISVSSTGKKVGGEGTYIDPGIPEYREHFSSVCEDIVKRYKVDGIHYDYVRYPDQPWGYSELALKRYYAETGAKEKPKIDDPKWLAWKREQVTAMVKLVHDRVKAINPNVMISASTIPWGDCPQDFTQSQAYTKACQDWKRWMEEGLIDANCPMVYRIEKGSWGPKSYRTWIEGCKKWRYGRSVYMGTDANNNNAEQMLAQIDAVRKGGLEGFLLFSFNEGHRNKKAEGLGKVLYPAPKLPVIQANGMDAKVSREAYDKGIELATKNKVADAEAQFKQAIELDPGSTEAFFRLGRCYLKDKDTAKAKECFTKVLELAPSHEGAQKELKALDEHS